MAIYDRDQIIDDTVANLSKLIIMNLTGASFRQYFPTGNPDNDDDTIEIGQKRAAELRRIREEFENVASGIITSSSA